MSLKSPHFKSVGQTYNHFQVTKISDIDELQCQLIELTHLPTGAVVMHIANDDPENLFCLSFQTIPSTSNGVAHILEHTVLCGSKNFPIKDPFFAMQRRSLNTFMNALTGADFTCYPAASQVPKDFYNLLEVYLDAVFHPIIDELSFIQEGHRLEFTDSKNPESPLEYKGIVFNEMKGALNSAGSRLNEAIGEALFPNLTYGINSGGDPENIPSLTYQELLDFYKQYYHPSRCLFFFYGNLPLEGHLDFIATRILNEAKPIPALPPIPLQPRFKEPCRITKTYPVAADEDLANKTLIAFSWLTCHILQQQEILALTVLEIILMETDASPLKMALLKSGMCSQASAYMEDEISEVPITIILRGCNPENADNLEQLIFKTIRDFLKSGIPLTSIENAIHQLEFHRSEITGDSSPFGLSLFMRSALVKQHGGEPTHGLKIHSLFNEMRERNLSDPNYFSELIKKHILDNPHFTRIVMIPDKQLADKELIKEKATLEAIKAKLSQKEKENLIKRAAQLLEFQQKQENADLDILPKVTLDDVPLHTREYPLIKEKIGQIHAYHHSTFTNQIVYADLVYPIPPIAEEDICYVRLFGSLISQMGSGGRTYEKTLEYIQANTGGIGAALSLNLQSNNHNDFYPTFFIRGKALHKKTNHLFTLMQEMAETVNLNDPSRLKEIILKQYTGLQGSLNQSGLKYATNLSAKGLSVSSKISNDWYGLEYYQKIKELSLNFDVHADKLIETLKKLQSMICAKKTPDLIVTCEREMYEKIKKDAFYGLNRFKNERINTWQPDYPLIPSYSQGRVISSPIAFISKVLSTVSYTEKDAPALNIISYLCDNLTLHTKLREQGGAYGGGAVSNAMSGQFYFYSYRDPNIVSTLDAFQQAVENLHHGDFENSDIEEAKLEIIQTLDAPVAPGSRGDITYGWECEGRTTEILQEFRNRILGLTRKDIIGAVERQLLPNMEKSATVVFASRELLERENEKLISQGKTPIPIEII